MTAGEPEGMPTRQLAGDHWWGRKLDNPVVEVERGRSWWVGMKREDEGVQVSKETGMRERSRSVATSRGCQRGR